MAYHRAIDAPVHLQWDQDSRYPLPDPGTAPGNCGPTSVCNIAHAYTGKHTGIYNTRRLGTTSLALSTSIGEQQTMLEKRGVPCIVTQLTMSAIKSYGSTGRRPIVLGLDMSRVPQSIAGHPFRGMHAVVMLQNAKQSNASGVLIRDPNFNRTFRRDPTDGRRFYPDWVIRAAFTDVHGWALVPKAPMPDISWYGRVRADAGAIIRTRPLQGAEYVFAEAKADGYTYRPDGKRLWKNGYGYYWNGEIYEKSGIKWYRVRTHNDRVRFIRVGSATVIRKA